MAGLSALFFLTRKKGIEKKKKVGEMAGWYFFVLPYWTTEKDSGLLK